MRVGILRALSLYDIKAVLPGSGGRSDDHLYRGANYPFPFPFSSSHARDQLVVFHP